MERIVVIANDQPGVIADLATALADAGVNIESLNTEKAGDQELSPSPPATPTPPSGP